MSEYAEGDKVEYKPDLNKPSTSFGYIQKIIRGGEALNPATALTHNLPPRYV
jgi:hypothetical protein